MARYCFDTSALVKNYHTEIGTLEVQALLTEPLAECVISRLATVETLSGFAGKVRTGALSTSAFAVLRGKFLADVKRRVVLPIRVVNAHYQLAGSLISHHGMSFQMRTLDAIQLAVALRFHQGLPVDRFICADQRLCAIAALEGLVVFNPEQP
jgi:uncharacterized protein